MSSSTTPPGADGASSPQTSSPQTSPSQTSSGPVGPPGAEPSGHRGRSRRRTVAVRAVQGAALVALLGGAGLYAAGSTTVELDVDGASQEVRLFGGDVEDVLAEGDVEVGERDLVAPSVGSEVQDGGTVVVRHARELELTVDGETSTHWTTALTLDEALDDLGVRSQGAVLSASRSMPLGREGEAVRLTTPKDVTVVADGAARPMTSTATSVEALLSEAGVAVDGDDTVSVDPTSPLTPGLVVTVTRVAVEEVAEEGPVPFETTERGTDDLFEGQTRVGSEGAEGVHRVTFRQTTADGEVVAKQELSDEVTQEPQARVVLVGTAERPAPAAEPEPAPAPEPDPAPAPEPERESAPARVSAPSSDDDDESSSGSSSSRSSSSSGSSSSGSSSGSSSRSSDPEPEPEPEPDTPAVSAPSGSTWDRLAQCESGGNWSISTGNGYYGGLQFDAQTWHAYGGSGLPHENSREQQIAIAEKVRDDRGGYGAWPACSRKLGL